MRLPRRPLPWILAGVGLLAMCCGALTVLGLIVDPPKTKATSSTARASSAPAVPATSASASPTPKPSPTPPPSSKPAAKPSSAAPADPDHRLCRLTSDGGTYYVWITSATAHRFDACAGGTVDPRTVDDLLLGTPGMDRRCILGDAYTQAHEAIVGVYSDTKAANLAAARSFCAAGGGTDSG